jgi:hypothetical protein
VKRGITLGWVLYDDGRPAFGAGDIALLAEARAEIVRFDFRLGSYGPGTWDQTILGHYRGVVGQLRQKGIEVIGLLGHGIVAHPRQQDWNAGQAEPANWDPTRGGPASGLGSYNDSLKAYVANAAAIVGAMQDGVGHWELWNEPNTWHQPGPPWGGSFIYPSLYARLLHEAIPVIRQRQQGSTVITGGLFAHNGGGVDPAAGSGRQYLSNVQQCLQRAGSGFDADAIGLHLYQDGGGQAQPALIDDYLGRIAGVAGGRPIYVTEAGWRSEALPQEAIGPLAPGGVTLQQQAENLHAFFEACSSSGHNVAATCWFTLYDNRNAPPEQKTYGLVGAASTPSQGARKPALEAFRALAA